MRRRRWACLPLLLCSLALQLRAGAAAAETPDRVALVIGNSSYSIGALKNPVADARGVAASLQALGFHVTLKENADFRTMLNEIRSFSTHAKDTDVRMFYYAGHGMQVNGRNYLIPVDITLGSEADIIARSVDLSELVAKLDVARSGLNILVLDACRNNPFSSPALMAANGRLARFRSFASKGLAEVNAPAGTLVEFATAPGEIALDGGSAEHSLYTRSLLLNIDVPGLPVEQLFKRVRNAVAKETSGRQIPWESSSLLGDFCFHKLPEGACR